MTEKVIHKDIGNKYAINKYNYRAFDDEEQQPANEQYHQPQSQMRAQYQEPEHIHHQVEHQSQNDGIASVHAETLLQKIDELSGSLVKMEMQMERQQADFNARLEEEKKRAYDDGFNAATTEFDISYKTKCDENDRMLSSSVKKLDETAATYNIKLDDIEKDLAKTAVSIAEQVIKKEIGENSSKVALALAKDLLSSLKDASKIRLKVNKADAAFLKEALSSDAKVSIEEDDAIQRGGVIVLSDVGNLDGNINARFLKVKEDLLGDND